MKIVFIGSLIGCDSEFPFIREMQKRERNFICYYPVQGKTYNTSIFDIKETIKIDAIIKASEYEEFRRFDKYFDLERIYIINNYHWRQRHWQSWLLWIKVYFHIKKQNPDILHYAWPLRWQRSILYRLKCHKVMTVHDPLPHSSMMTKKEEKARLKAFSHADRFILLSDVHKESFKDKYHIDESRITISRFGYYDWMDYLGKPVLKQQKYILFWGQIQSHKGVDILLSAMLKVHEQIPDLKCIIAGKGNFSFDINPYLGLDYITIINRFVSMNELSELLNGCLFVVCPYKDATQSGVVQNTFSMSVPLIVTNVGALPQSVLHGITGLVVPPNDVNSLSNAIIKLATNETLRSLIKKNINEVWKKEMGWSDVANSYISCYRMCFEQLS